MNLKKSVRRVNRVIIHCTATPEGRDVSPQEIKDWHVKGNGWSDIGYHYVITLDGEVHEGRNIDRTGAHTKGANKNSIGVVYVGGVDEDMNALDTRTETQDTALVNLIQALLEMYPGSTVHGHNEFASKACPSFDVQEEYGYLNNL
jgi:N-acetylmuramoyl-L-alanine amidase